MPTQTDTLARWGAGGRLNWLVGGAAGGLAGAIIFGVVLWLVDPAIVTEAIPKLYGFDVGEPTVWAFHILHGIVLGTIFAFLITRPSVLGTLTADVETPFLDTVGPNARIAAAGLVYGLTLWVIVPGVILTVLVSVGDTSDPLPWASIYNLVGHLLYGVLLGALVSLFTDIETPESRAMFEETGDS